MPENYTRIPDSVLNDPELELSDLRVYAVLSRHTYQGRSAKPMATRKISALSRLSRPTVHDSLERLVKREHITVSGEGKRKRVYLLNSTVFAQKQGEVTEVQYGPTGKRMVSVERKWSWSPTTGTEPKSEIA